MKNLVDNSEHEAEAARHHRMLAEELVKTDDHFILMPAFGCDGVNCWDGIGEDK